MSADMVAFYKMKAKRMGNWMAVRYMRNRGVAFEYAHFIILGIPPRRA